jgi:hypothetical protein
MTREHRQLLGQYQNDLRTAMAVAEAWWRDRLADELTESQEGAEAELRRRWPDGPPSRPLVIGVIQKYLRLCDQLNQRLGEDAFLPLNQFVIDGLNSKDSRDLLKFTRPLSYWSIGVAESGELV